MSGIIEGIRRMARPAKAEEGRRVRAELDGVTIAESDRTVVLEGNHYFPPEDVRDEHLQPSDHRTVCPWKGTASYYDVVADGIMEPAAAWYYPEPSAAAESIRGRIAFWRGVRVAPVE